MAVDPNKVQPGAGQQGDPAAPAATSGTTADGGTPVGDGTTYETWDAFVEAHPEAKPLHEAQTAGLKKALDDERDKNKAAAKQLRELAKTADPETADALRKAADEKDSEIKALQKQLDFQNTAVALGCRVVDKAWAFAQSTGMSAADMKADPDLAHWFGQPAAPQQPQVNAGAGAGQQPARKDDFNANLRRQLGVET